MLSAISSLISGSTGVNSGQLVSDLVAANRAGRDQQLNARASLNQSRISALASTSSALNTFADALSGLLNGRGFAGELVSSRTDLASATFVTGQLPDSLPATVDVRQLASPQRTVSRVFANSSDPVGEGTLTLNSAAGSFNITIDASNNSLSGLRDAINTSDSGVTATILTDKNGSRLVFEGSEGVDNSFTLTAPAAPNTLNDFTFPAGGAGGMTSVAVAADSIVRIDGIELTNSSNTLSNAISGIQLNLLKAEAGSVFTISGDQPTNTVKSLVSEFVSAYNQLRTGLNSATAAGTDGDSAGPLAGNRGVRDMVRALGNMTSTILSASGPFRTLADIGVQTNNDGTLLLNEARIDAALAANPLAVSRMLEPAIPSAANPGLAGTMESIRNALQGENGSLTVAQNRLDAIAADVLRTRQDINADSEFYEAQLARTFANMDRQLAILRSTGSYLEQQIAVWNGSNN